MRFVIFWKLQKSWFSWRAQNHYFFKRILTILFWHISARLWFRHVFWTAESSLSPALSVHGPQTTVCVTFGARLFGTNFVVFWIVQIPLRFPSLFARRANTYLFCNVCAHARRLHTPHLPNVNFKVRSPGADYVSVKLGLIKNVCKTKLF